MRPHSGDCGAQATRWNTSALGGRGCQTTQTEEGEKREGRTKKKRANILSSLDGRHIFLFVSLSSLCVHGLKLQFCLPSEAFSAGLSIEEPILSGERHGSYQRGLLVIKGK